MDEQQFQSVMNQQDQALMMGRTAYMQQSNENESLLRDLTDVQKDISETELSLQGLRLNDEGVIESYNEPKCNKIGAASIIQLMKAMVSTVTAMSNFEEDQIRILVIELGDDLVENLTFNKVRYEIVHEKAISDIVDIVCDKAFSVGMMAKDNGLRQLLRKNIMETTINAQGSNMKMGKGGLGSILGLGKH